MDYILLAGDFNVRISAAQTIFVSSIHEVRAQLAKHDLTQIELCAFLKGKCRVDVLARTND